MKNTNYNFLEILKGNKKGEKEPIFKGCPNQHCFCTGECKEIVGWKNIDKKESMGRTFIGDKLVR